jgi:hypothetical protein
MSKVNWKKSKPAYRITITCPTDETVKIIEDILEERMTPDTMTDFFAYYNALFGEDNWNTKTSKVELWNWKEYSKQANWENFYAKWGTEIPHI